MNKYPIQKHSMIGAAHTMVACISQLEEIFKRLPGPQAKHFQVMENFKLGAIRDKEKMYQYLNDSCKIYSPGDQFLVQHNINMAVIHFEYIVAIHMACTSYIFTYDIPTVEECGWPTFDPEQCAAANFDYPIQVKGKFSGTVSIDKNLKGEQLEALVKNHPTIIALIKDKEVIKFVIVPNKIISIVLK